MGPLSIVKIIINIGASLITVSILAFNFKLRINEAKASYTNSIDEKL
jgi:hypothetical protein